MLIFMHGIMERSGTNFFANLLALHPDCMSAPIIMEDYLLYYADLLVKYAKHVYQHYGRHDWEVEGKLGSEDILCKCLGDALISFLRSQFSIQDSSRNEGASHDSTRLSSQISTKRLITKTPSVVNLEYFFKLFPCSPLLILVRDGRAVVESGVRSSLWKHEPGMRNWAKAARVIEQFEERYRTSEHKYLIVRYEDLCDHLEDEVRKVFDFLELDPSAYDFEKAGNLPVFGSSVFRGGSKDRVHWNPVVRTAEFKPLLRWAHWNRPKHERFNWVAGKYLTEFGYDKFEYTDRKFLWSMYNILLDIVDIVPEGEGVHWRIVRAKDWLYRKVHLD
jgi:protein-tyrosine sulfotransferase